MPLAVANGARIVRKSRQAGVWNSRGIFSENDQMSTARYKSFD